MKEKGKPKGAFPIDNSAALQMANRRINLGNSRGPGEILVA